MTSKCTCNESQPYIKASDIRLLVPSDFPYFNLDMALLTSFALMQCAFLHVDEPHLFITNCSISDIRHGFYYYHKKHNYITPRKSMQIHYIY